MLASLTVKRLTPKPREHIIPPNRIDSVCPLRICNEAVPVNYLFFCPPPPNSNRSPKRLAESAQYHAMKSEPRFILTSLVELSPSFTRAVRHGVHRQTDRLHFLPAPKLVLTFLTSRASLSLSPVSAPAAAAAMPFFLRSRAGGPPGVRALVGVGPPNVLLTGVGAWLEPGVVAALSEPTALGL